MASTAFVASLQTSSALGAKIFSAVFITLVVVSIVVRVVRRWRARSEG